MTTLLTAAKRIALREMTWPVYGPYPPPPYPLAPLHAPLRVMAHPPTVTVGAANAASVISGSTRTAPDAGVFTYAGTRRGFGASYPNDTAYSPAFIADPTGAKPLYVAGNWAVEFQYTGREIEIQLLGKGATARYRLTVVGEGHESSGVHNGPPADGNFYLVHYDFGTAAPRTLRWEFDGTVAFVGTYSNTGTTTISATAREFGPKVIILGDSFTEGSNAAASFTAFGARLGEQMGWHDVAMSGWGGTGYVNDNGGAAKTFGTRLQKDVIDAAPDVVIVYGAINDSAVTPATVGTAATSLYTALKTALPAVKLIVHSIQWKNGRPVAGVMQVNDAILTAAASPANLVIDEIGGVHPYDGTPAHYVDTGDMTGSGYVGGEQGDGNSDRYTDTDTTHPTQAGHDYRGSRLAQRIARALPALVEPATGWPTPPVPPSYYAINTLALSGLVGYWRLGESSGTTAADETGTNNGTIAGAPAMGGAGLLTGDANTAITFDGTNDAISFPAAAYTFTGTSSFSIRALVKVPSNKASYPTIIGRRESIGGFNQGFLFYFDAGGPLSFARYSGSGTTDLAASGSFPAAGTILCVWATYDGANIRLYANAVLKATTASTGAIASGFATSLTIGANGGVDAWFNETIDEVAIFSRAVTLAEIQTDYDYATGVLP